MKWAVSLIIASVLASGLSAADQTVPVRISKFSGKAVPRFETLKYAAVNGRAGPSADHDVLWRYERKGLPLLVVKETRNWRRVRDPAGDEVWVHARMLVPADTAYVQTTVTILREPSDPGREIARFEQGLLVRLGRCEAGWCQISAKGYSGWAPASHLWGNSISETAL